MIRSTRPAGCRAWRGSPRRSGPQQEERQAEDDANDNPITERPASRRSADVDGGLACTVRTRCSRRTGREHVAAASASRWTRSSSRSGRSCGGVAARRSLVEQVSRIAEDDRGDRRRNDRPVEGRVEVVRDQCAGGPRSRRGEVGELVRRRSATVDRRDGDDHRQLDPLASTAEAFDRASVVGAFTEEDDAGCGPFGGRSTVAVSQPSWTSRPRQLILVEAGRRNAPAREPTRQRGFVVSPRRRRHRLRLDQDAHAGDGSRTCSRPLDDSSKTWSRMDRRRSSFWRLRRPPSWRGRGRRSRCASRGRLDARDLCPTHPAREVQDPGRPPAVIHAAYGDPTSGAAARATVMALNSTVAPATWTPTRNWHVRLKYWASPIAAAA